MMAYPREIQRSELIEPSFSQKTVNAIIIILH